MNTFYTYFLISNPITILIVYLFDYLQFGVYIHRTQEMFDAIINLAIEPTTKTTEYRYKREFTRPSTSIIPASHFTGEKELNINATCIFNKDVHNCKSGIQVNTFNYGIQNTNGYSY